LFKREIKSDFLSDKFSTAELKISFFQQRVPDGEIAPSVNYGKDPKAHHGPSCQMQIQHFGFFMKSVVIILGTLPGK